MHPLDRAKDDGDASPIDPNFPGRYFVDPTCRSGETDQTILPGAFPGDVITARYQLPSGVTCSHCVVQMAHCECVCSSIMAWLNSTTIILKNSVDSSIRPTYVLILGTSVGRWRLLSVYTSVVGGVWCQIIL